MTRKRRILVVVSVLMLGGLIMGADAARKSCWTCYCTDGSGHSLGEIPFKFIAHAKCVGVCFPRAANVSGVEKTNCLIAEDELSPIPDPAFAQ